MEVKLAALADSANLSQEGKLNVLGIFNKVGAHSFPAQHPGSAFIIVLEAHPTEAGQHEVEVLFVDEDGQVQMKAGITVEFPRPEDPLRPMHANLIMPIPMLPLPSEGVYRFDILVDRRHEAEVELVAQVVPGA